MKKILYPLGVIGIISMVFFFLLPLTVVNAESDPEHKIDICHATSSHTNPYTTNNVDKNSTVGGHDDHDGPIWYEGIVGDWGDIIPPYTYYELEFIGFGWSCPDGYSPSSSTCPYFCQKDAQPGNPSKCVNYQFLPQYDFVEHQYLGKNWTTEGQAIWNNGCKIPEPEPVEHMSIDKSAVSKCIEGGIEVIYTITVTNDGDLRIPVYTVTDTLDEKVDCSQITEITPQGGNCSNGEILWSQFMLDPEEEKSGTYKLLVSDEDYGIYTNQVSAIYGEGRLEAYDSLKMELFCEIEEPTYCEQTIDGDTVWSAWVIDPNDDTQEMRTGTISLWDAEDNTHSCGTRTVTEYQPIEDEGDVLGESDEKGEVLGTSIVSADTAGGDSLIISLVEFILVILSAVSINYTLKKKLQLK